VTRRLIRLVTAHRLRFWIASVALMVESAVYLVYPQAAGFAVDAAITDRSLGRLTEAVVVLAMIAVAHGGVVWLRYYMTQWLGERVVTDLRGTVFERLLGLPVGWFHDRRTGELVGRLARDVAIVQHVVGSELSTALGNLVQVAGGVALLFVLDARLTVTLVLVIPPLTVTAVSFGRVLRRMSRAAQDRLAQVGGQAQEAIGGIATVQAFVREPREARRYRAGVEVVFEQGVALGRWDASYQAALLLTGGLCVAALLWLGSHAVMRGDLTAGDLTAFALYAVIVTTSLGAVATLWGSLQRATGASERLFAIIDLEPAIVERDDPRPLPAGGGAIAYRRVSFTYPSRPGKPVLEDVDLTIAPGETVALVGHSGAGKSTLIELLFRFHDVDAGAVCFEGVDVRELALAELRKAIALVSQEPVLFSGSIRDNIAYGHDGAGDDEIIAAARSAHAHELITGLPAGYDTTIGERGVRLSGGQRQRIAIARAVLANPRVLILDEASSNLDTESEALVRQALTRVMTGRTTIVIAHRLSTVRHAHRIVVLDQGRIVAQGTHEALLAQSDSYRRLVESQIVTDR